MRGWKCPNQNDYTDDLEHIKVQTQWSFDDTNEKFQTFWVPDAQSVVQKLLGAFLAERRAQKAAEDQQVA